MRDYIDKFTIISHARSGTHFLYETLVANFDLRPKKKQNSLISGADRTKFHFTPKQLSELEKVGGCNMSLSDFFNEHNPVYIIRDLRDTLVALWFYYQHAPVNKDPVGGVIRRKSFSQYIKGMSVGQAKGMGLVGNEINILSLLDPIQYWSDFTLWSQCVYTIKFEDLKLNPNKVLEDFSFFFDLRPKTKNYVSIDRLVGYFPRKGIIGDWKNIFSEKDEEYVLSRAQDVMSKFDYV